jgi:heme-binding uptake protein ChaN (Tiki superfamily)
MTGAFAAFVLALVLPAAPDALRDHLRQHGKPPATYLLAKLDDHRIVIAGENHWQRHDAQLIGDLAPELRRRGVALAMEFFPVSSQGDIDALISGPEWNPELANAIMRAGDWPYVQYRDILRRAWEASRAPGAQPLKVLALGPPADWREQGIRYDAFMADHVRAYATDEQHRILVYCGMHHAFTRYLQVERFGRGRATEFMDRMGNILWRQFGQEVFLVALHKPEGCGAGEDAFATLCAPLDGAVDCAAVRNSGTPVGFDILGSPIAETQLDAKNFYAKGHPLLRMIDFADGYVWQAPVDDAGMVELIPLEEYAPEDAGNADRKAEWRKRADDLAHPERRPARASLPGWRADCPLPPTPAAAPPK